MIEDRQRFIREELDHLGLTGEWLVKRLGDYGIEITIEHLINAMNAKTVFSKRAKSAINMGFIILKDYIEEENRCLASQKAKSRSGKKHL